MKKGNRLAAMIMAAVLAAGTLTGPVFAADYTTTGEILTEEGSYDYSSENVGLTDETVQENSALSIDPASGDTDPAAVEEISSESETEDEEGTEAAAVTVAIGVFGSAPPSEEEYMYVNHSFIYAIVCDIISFDFTCFTCIKTFFIYFINCI